METIILMVVAAVIGVVIGHSFARANSEVRWDDKPIDTQKPLERLAWDALLIITYRLSDYRPKNWLGNQISWPLRANSGRMKRGEVTYTPTLTCDIFDEDVDISITEIIDNDPQEKFVIAATKLADKLRAQNIVEFGDFELPPGLDFSYKLRDGFTGVGICVLRGYDLTENVFKTKIRAKVLVKS